MAKSAARGKSKRPAKKADPSIPEQIEALRKMIVRQAAVRTEQHNKLFAVCDGLLAFMKMQMLEHRNMVRNQITTECVAIQGRIKLLAEEKGVAQWNKFWGENAERITEQFEILKKIEAKYLAPGEYVSPFSGTASGNVSGSFERGVL